MHKRITTRAMCVRVIFIECLPEKVYHKWTEDERRRMNKNVRHAFVNPGEAQR